VKNFGRQLVSFLFPVAFHTDLVHSSTKLVLASKALSGLMISILVYGTLRFLSSLRNSSFTEPCFLRCAKQLIVLLPNALDLVPNVPCVRCGRLGKVGPLLISSSVLTCRLLTEIGPPEIIMTPWTYCSINGKQSALSTLSIGQRYASLTADVKAWKIEVKAFIRTYQKEEMPSYTTKSCRSWIIAAKSHKGPGKRHRSLY
jgi:hypothetical protein